MILKTLQFLCFSLLGISHYSVAINAYQPDEANALELPWSWKEVGDFQNKAISVVEQMQDGSIWLGSTYGMFKYDGKNWYDFADIKELQNQNILSILQSRDGKVYLRSQKALMVQSGQNWIPIHTTTANQAKLIEDDNGTIWATDQKGIISVHNGSLKSYELNGSTFDDILIDKDSNLWLVEERTGNLHRYPIRQSVLYTNEGQIIAYPGINESSNMHHSYSISRGDDCLLHASQLEENPLYCYKPTSQTWQAIETPKGLRKIHYGIDVDEKNRFWLWGPFYISIFNGEKWNVITAPEYDIPRSPFKIKRTEDQTFWLYSFYSKLWRISNNNNPWGRGYRGLKFQMEFPKNMIWYISEDDKLILQNRSTDQWVNFTHTDQVIDTPRNVTSDFKNRIWVSGSHKGAAAISYASIDEIIAASFKNKHTENGVIWQSHRFAELGVQIGRQNFKLIEDGTAVFGAHLAFKGGLIHLNPNKDETKTEINKIYPPLAPRRITAIEIDQDSNLWVSSGPRLFKHNLEKLNKEEMREEPTYTKLQINSKISDIVRDSKNNLWLATRLRGVLLFNGKEWIRHNKNYDLDSLAIFDLRELEDQSITAITDTSIYRYDGFAWSVAFPEISAFNVDGANLRQDLNGDIWLNIDHKNLAKPESRLIQVPAEVPQQNKTGFLYTQQYTFDTKSPNTKIDAFNRNIQEGDYNIVHWSATDPWGFADDKSLQYSYKLNEGNWSRFSYNTSKIFENLAAGEHQLLVTARDLDFNIDKSPAKITFKVIPPVWKQLWFQISVLAALAIFSAFIYIVVRLRIKHELHIANIRSNFFTNISHELKTPLTLILAPAEKLASSDISDDKIHLATTIKRNAERLLTMVEQLLDYRKIASGFMRLKLHDGDIIQLTREQLEPFELLADSKKISLHFRPTAQSAFVRFDQDVYIKILNNLVLNAIKYTPDEGLVNIILKITGNATDNSRLLILMVEDTGPGVNKSEIEQIFEQFYRSDDTESQSKGSGIGLALCKELVDLCDGVISVDSPLNPQTNDGSRFTVTIPIQTPNTKALDKTSDEQTKSSETNASDNPLKARILVVEDDKDIADFIFNELNQQYNVSLAENGYDGLKLAESLMPDLIITDLMMPILNGLEMCKRLKSNEIISHIPIIILTAKSSNHAELQGLSSGADDYIAKPFQMPILLKRIENLIQARKTLRENFSSNKQEKAISDSPTPTDKDFLQRALKIIHDNIDNAEFSVNDFADAMHMSYQNSYLKTKALTNMGPQDLIRSVRLERAMQLIKSSPTKPNITDIAGMVGIDNYSYFSRSFKKKFGIQPSKVWQES